MFQDYKYKQKQNYQIILKQLKLNQLVDILEQCSIFVLNIEMDNNVFITPHLIGISILIEPNKAFYIPINHNCSYISKQLSLSLVLKILHPILTSFNIKKIGHDIRYYASLLLNYGIKLNGMIFDTMIASYLIDPSKKNHKLDQIIFDWESRELRYTLKSDKL